MRLIHSSAAVLILLLSACEKKSESTDSESGPARPTKTARAERERGDRNERHDRSGRGTEAYDELSKALEAAEREPDPVAREKAIAAVAWDAIDVDHELAHKAFAALTPGGAEARRLIAHFAMRMADDDPESALEWARGLEDAGERDDALSRIATVISDSDPKKAIVMMEEVPEGLMRDRAAIQITQRWSQKAPADAAQWVSTLPEGRGRKAAIRSLANSWLKTDAPAFAAWTSKQQANLPELASVIADSLRFNADVSARNKQLDVFTDSAFRQKVEESLNKGPIFPPPLPTPPPGREKKE